MKAFSVLTLSLLMYSCSKEKPFLAKKNDIDSEELNSCNLGVVKNIPPLRLSTGNDMVVNNTPLKAGDGVVLLDFNGETVSNTSWNVSGDIKCAPADLLTEQMQAILDTNIKRFAPFNIKVTTSEKDYNRAPVNKRMRLIFTTTYSWFGNSAGGVSYTGSFTWGDDTPCFVFTNLLGYSTKNITEASTHEVGHTFGLKHQAVWSDDCVLLNSYNRGNASEAPIMGIAYYAQTGSWWVGPNTYSCLNIQDDKAIIASIVGYN